MVHKDTLMSSEYEPPEVEEIGTVEDLTGGSPPGEGDNTMVDAEPGVSTS
jgi:hypothetical protein